MKTNVLKTAICLLGIATLSLTSCTQNEDLEMAAGRAIKFQNNVLTKAQDATGAFNVVAYKGTNAARADFPNDNVRTFADTYTATADGGSFTGGPYYYNGISSYWFFGYAATDGTGLTANPTGAVYSDGVSGAPTLTFTATNGDVDLVTMATGVVAPVSQSQAVAALFEHALSRVRFSASTTTYDENTPIAITKIEFTPNTKNGSIDQAGFSAGTMIAETATDVTPYSIASGFQNNLTDQMASVTITDKFFYVVPQTPSQADNLVVTYTVNGDETTKKFSLTTKMESGKAYNYAISIGLNSITFSVTLDDWDLATETPAIPAS